jgi:hypothetical protein
MLANERFMKIPSAWMPTYFHQVTTNKRDCLRKSDMLRLSAPVSNVKKKIEKS